ncbi:putative Protein NO VEIN C-terminal domain-containing protein [Seiridium unicorne]|uniref:Protein NO VEIN C-terminal domain-containing protein n=1 Tax=Seiridium unicorne TaxID=138068 RepID=A0ABR2UG26_9PEZI
MPLPVSSQPACLEEAKKLVEDITEEHGYMADEELDSLDEKMRKRILDVMFKKDRMSGKSVITLAKNLYSINTRFVFELLQNTDDNNYSVATARGAEPYAHFKVLAEKVVLECNEDGFTEENLIAICDVGRSSKIGAQGYIGEKGIGFKSVFMAAYKVHIQSGHFSFSFTHRRGGSGMGMISPVWEEPDTSLLSGITRITLFLHDTGSAIEIQNQHQQVVQQFREIQDTHLLFLRKIRRIQISFAYNSEDHTTTTFEVANSSQGSRITLRKFVEDDPAVETHYHVSRHTAYHLPESENRVNSESTETPSASSAPAETILAFPLNKDSIPIIRTQQIFAFLPIRDMGFKFMMQSDFVTQANRQDIVTTSPRNLGLVNHIAITFANAMEELCQDTTLQFQWMKYLPQDDDFPWDSYWKSVVANMKEKVAAKNLMRPRSGDSLKKIDQVGRFTDDALDDNGEPLLEDISPEIYLSKGYDSSTIDLHLKGWGLRKLNMKQFLDRAEADLTRTTSRLKSPQSSQSWHSKTSVVLDRPFQMPAEHHQNRIRAFRLIPIQHGKWISAQQSNTPLVFPTVWGASIPKSLDLNIIDERATANSERRRLFESLGAKALSVADVRQMILEKYPSVVNRTQSFGTTTSENEISLSHLAFLYLTHNVAGRKPNEYRYIRLLTQESLLVAPQSQDVYIKDDHRYGMSKLLKDLPRFSVAFLSSYYLENPPRPCQGPEPKISWQRWLQTSLNVHSRPKLVANGTLTDLFRHIIEHDSNNIPGILQYYWKDIGKELEQSEEMVDELRRVVLNTKGYSAQLGGTFLPLPELKARASEYLGEANTDEFPFLDLSNTLEPEDLSKWNFLHDKFGVGKQDNVEFYLDILSVLANQYPHPDSEMSKKVYMLYETIYRKSRESLDPIVRQDLQEVVLSYFRGGSAEDDSSDGLILVPDRDFRTWLWTQPSQCRWDAPSTLATLEPVAYLFGKAFTDSAIDRAALEQFLKVTLRIGNCTSTDMISELQYHVALGKEDKLLASRSDGHYSAQAARGVYRHLQKLSSSLETSEKQELVNAFKCTPLIFAAESWHVIEDCLWSSATEIEGKVILNALYPDLESLFVEVLGVKTLTLQMAYDKLENLGKSNVALVSEIKSTWNAFNSLLSQAGSEPDPGPLLKERIFPVKYPNGHIGLCSGASPFAIIDRKQHGSLFSGKAMILDYTFEEVHQLQATIKWAGLNTRYTSVAAKEVSAIVGRTKTAVSNPDCNLKSKAHGLCRIGVHFNTPRARNNQKSLYQVLKNVETFETDGIATELHLRQGDSTVTVRTSQSNLHIEASRDILRVFIPRDRKQQQLCYSQTLPRRLYNWLMEQDGPGVPTTESIACVSVIMQTLTVSYDNVEAILENSGITELGFPDEYEAVPGSPAQANGQSSNALRDSHALGVALQGPSTSNKDDESSSGRETYVEGTHTPNSSLKATYSRSASTARAVEDASSLRSHDSPNHQSLFSQVHQSQRPRGPFVPFPDERRSSSLAHAVQIDGSPELSTNEEDPTSDYTAFLSKVIEIARSSSLPHQSTLRTASLRRSVNRLDGQQDPDQIITFNASNKSERDRMIGAAGELYVFELLSKMQSVLPGFGTTNWMSNIRNYVKQHPDYSNMITWKGRETADIVYWDVAGTLTKELIELAYLDKSLWADSRPTYYIEVKTTTGPRETPFYMSKGQFKRMQATSNVGPRVSTAIYVIFRVSDIGSDSADLAIYVDPECMRQNCELEFTTETYSVTPWLGGGSNAPKDLGKAPNAATRLSWKAGSASGIGNSLNPSTNSVRSETPPGTANTPFSPTNMDESSVSLAVNSFQNILFQETYARWSAEELRLTDYGGFRRFGTVPRNNASAGEYGLSGATPASGFFGSSSISSVVAPSSTSTSTPTFFGPKASGNSLSGGATTKTASQGSFGRTPLFGSTTSKDAAGSTKVQASQTSSSSTGTGLFGARIHDGPPASESTGGVFGSSVHPTGTTPPEPRTGASFSFGGTGSSSGTNNSPPAAKARDNSNAGEKGTNRRL